MSKHYDKDGKRLPDGFAFFTCSVCGGEEGATGAPFANDETGKPECTACHFGINPDDQEGAEAIS